MHLYIAKRRRLLRYQRPLPTCHVVTVLFCGEKLHIFKVSIWDLWRNVYTCNTIKIMTMSSHSFKVSSCPSAAPLGPSYSSPKQSLLCFLWLQISLYVLDFYINGIIERTLFCLASFTLHDYVKVCACCTLYQVPVPFRCWVVFHCVGIPQASYPLICWRTSELFPVCDYCKPSCPGDSFRSLCANRCSHFLWVNTEDWTVGSHHRHTFKF